MSKPDRIDRARWAADDDMFRIFAPPEVYNAYVNGDDDEEDKQ